MPTTYEFLSGEVKLTSSQSPSLSPTPTPTPSLTPTLIFNPNPNPNPSPNACKGDEVPSSEKVLRLRHGDLLIFDAVRAAW